MINVHRPFRPCIRTAGLLYIWVESPLWRLNLKCNFYFKTLFWKKSREKWEKGWLPPLGEATWPTHIQNIVTIYGNNIWIKKLAKVTEGRPSKKKNILVFHFFNFEPRVERGFDIFGHLFLSKKMSFWKYFQFFWKKMKFIPLSSQLPKK